MSSFGSHVCALHLANEEMVLGPTSSSTSFSPLCFPFACCINLDAAQRGVPVLENIALCSLHALSFTNASQNTTLCSAFFLLKLTPLSQFSKDPNFNCMTQDHCSNWPQCHSSLCLSLSRLSPMCHSGFSPDIPPLSDPPKASMETCTTEGSHIGINWYLFIPSWNEDAGTLFLVQVQFL